MAVIRLGVCALITFVALSACSSDSNASHTGLGVESGNTEEKRGDPNDCSSFLDEAPQTVAVTIRNDTASPIYFATGIDGTCGAIPAFWVKPASGGPAGPFSCSTCEEASKNLPGGCLDGCPSAEVTQLAAGESLHTEWDGRQVGTVETLPSACTLSHLDASCSVMRRAEPGSHVFTATASAAYSCGRNGCGECTPTASGGCTMAGGMLAGNDIVAQVTVDLDASYGVTGSGTASNSSAAATRGVELVFSPE